MMTWVMGLLVAGCGGSAPPVALAPVDLVVVGASASDATVRAVGVSDGVITHIETGDAADALVARGERVLRAPVVTAGFVDAHAHPIGLGRLESQVDVTGIATYAQTLRALESTPGSGWIVGRGWDQNDWSDAPEGMWPRAVDADAVTGERPMALRRVDGHAVWLNSAALVASGITKDTPDPDGGRLVRSADGTPTGVLIDEAMSLVASPEDSVQDRARYLTLAATRMAEAGLTGAHAMGVSDASYQAYAQLAEDGALPIRIWAYLEAESDGASKLMTEGPWTIGNLSVVGVKAFADGALGSRGAWLTEPYADEPGHHGTPIHAPADIQTWANDLLAVDAGLAVHSIGDRAVHHTLEAFAAARSAHPDATAALRVEHAQLVRPEDRGRFAELGVVASMQPTHATSDMPWAEERVGGERIDWSYSWKTLREAGAILVFGSDFPVESHRPALGLWSAVHRTDLQGQPDGGWRPEERVTVDVAVDAFTRAPARIVGRDDLGEIAVGQRGDFTLWSPSDTEPWTPVGTVVDGVVLYDATTGAVAE